MNRLKIKKNQPPLRYILQARPNKIARMKSKVTNIANTILNYFREYQNRNHHKNLNQKNSQQIVQQREQQQVQNEKQIMDGKEELYVIKAIHKSANNIVNYRDISSQSEGQAENNQASNKKQNELSQPTLTTKNQPQQRMVSYNQNVNNSVLNRQLLKKRRNDMQKQKIQANGAKVIIQQTSSKQNDDSKNNLSYSNSELEEDSLNLSFSQQSVQFGKSKRQNSYGSIKAMQMVKKFEIQQYIQEDDESIYSFNVGEFPKKRVKLINERYLGYVENLSKKKFQVLKKVQKYLLNKPIKQLQLSLNKQKIEKNQSSIYIQKLQVQLKAIHSRKKQNFKILKSTSCFSPVIIQNRPKKLNLNIEKILQAVKQPKKIQNKVPQVQSEAATQVKSFQIDSYSTPFGIKPSGNIFSFPSSISNNITNKPQNILNSNEKSSSMALFSGLFSSKAPESQKKEDAINLFSHTLPAQQAAIEKIKEIEVKKNKIDNRSQQHIKNNQIKDFSLKQQQNKDPLNENNLQNLPQKKSEPKPPLQNPFTKKAQPLRLVLPEIGSNFNISSLFTTKIPAPPVTVVPATATQKQKQTNSNGGFSTPTKNIYQKYPDIQPNQSVSAQPIPESQEDQDSMLDESQHSASRKDDVSPLRGGTSLASNNLNSNSGSALGGFSNTSQPIRLFATGDARNSYLDIVPKIDIQKSMEMFGKSGTNNGKTSDALWGNPVDDVNRKKNDSSKNNKKKKQQRAYG